MKFSSRQSFFEKTVNEYKTTIAKNPGLTMPIITSSSLRLEQYFNAATTQYNFQLLSGVNGTQGNIVQANEVRLEQNDNFHIDEIGIYIATTTASTDTNFRLLTNNNEIFLGSAAIANSYMNFYGGNMNINVNQTDVLTNYRISKHFMVGQTQRLSSTVNNNFDQVDMSTDGLLQLGPNIMLSGAGTNKITINLNNSVALALASNNSRIVIIFDGLRAQNAAVKLGSTKG